MWGTFLSPPSPSMNGIEITSTLTHADWQAYQMAWASRLQGANGGRGSKLRAIAIVGAIIVGLATALATLLHVFDERMPFVAFVFGATFALGVLIFIQRRIQQRALPDPEGAVLGRCSMTFDAGGIRLQKHASRSEYGWSLVKDATLTTEHLFLWIDRVSALIIPLRDLPSGTEPATFADALLTFAANSGNDIASPALIVAANDAVIDATGAPIATASFKDFLRACIRLWSLRTVDRTTLLITDGTAIGIVLASAAFMIGVDWLQAEKNSVFSPYGMLACAWYVLIALIAAWASSRLSEPRIEFRRLVLVAVAFLPMAMMLRLCLSFWVPGELWTGAIVLCALYATIVLERALRSITLRRQPRAVATIMLLACCAAWIGKEAYFSTQFWFPNYEEMADEEVGADGDTSYLERWRAAESTLFEQADRIRAAVDALERPQSLDAAAFFVGFAGMGEQRVFAGEITLAGKVIGDKFDTEKRAISLVNDRRDLDTLPLASPTALRHTLAGIARRMDIDDDVLFLSLSSHGSKNASISVSNWSLPLNDLSAKEVADSLRASGIKWRVVIVSACYAGTFIEPLRDDNTIVITASASDRTSFGCSDDRDLTYFGEAFYRDALPSAPDIRAAFEQTKAAISTREKLEGKDESRPQAHFGVAIEAHLAALRAR
jgi:hypothetical protein